MKNIRRVLSLAALPAALLLSAYTLSGTGRISWAYFGTPAVSGGLTYDTTTGEPTATEYSRDLPAALPPLPPELMGRARSSLREGKDLRENNQGIRLDTDGTANIHFQEASNVWVTFLSDGSKYRNSVGYFLYDPASPPQTAAEVEEKILFVSATAPKPLDHGGGGHQNTFNLGAVPAGKALGFVVVADGYSATGRTVAGKAAPGVREVLNRSWVFYTLPHLNPETPVGNLNKHAVVLRDQQDSSPGYQRLVLGFEVFNREQGGDHDFNDVVLAIHVDNRNALGDISTVPTTTTASAADTDADGIIDSLDEFPSDPKRAYTRFYPSRDGFATLAYEDQWPLRGDYDLNDMVMRYRTKEFLNAAREVVAIDLDYRLDARGAYFESGFAVRLPTIKRSDIANATLAVGGAAPANFVPEEGQTDATFVLFNSAATHLPGTSKACSFANTQAECPSVPYKTFKLSMNFGTPQASSRLSAPYDPFIFRTANRGHEIHLPGRTGTSRVQNDLYGTGDDRTNLANGKSYQDGSRRPWAMHIPTEWRYPNETIDVALPYPDFLTWLSSGGTQSGDWFVDASITKWLYVFH